MRRIIARKIGQLHSPIGNPHFPRTVCDVPAQGSTWGPRAIPAAPRGRAAPPIRSALRAAVHAPGGSDAPWAIRALRMERSALRAQSAFRRHPALAARALHTYLPPMSSRRPIRPGIHARGAPEPEAGALSPDVLREAFSRWASGVTVVAVRDEPHVAAITATAFVPVSIDPPLVLVCVGVNASVLPLLDTGARFAISILSENLRRLASIFADTGPLGREHLEPEGEPPVTGASVGFACPARDVHAAADPPVARARIDRL